MRTSAAPAAVRLLGVSSPAEGRGHLSTVTLPQPWHIPDETEQGGLKLRRTGGRPDTRRGALSAEGGRLLSPRPGEARSDPRSEVSLVSFDDR